MPESPICARASARVEVSGWTVAAHFGEPPREYEALRRGVGLVDLPFRGRTRVTGADRREFLQGMLSNDLRALGEGDGCAALALTGQGKVVGDLLVLVGPDAIALDGVEPGLRAATEALGRFVVADDVELAMRDDTHALGLIGPTALETLTRLGAEAPTEPYAHRSVTVAGVPVEVVHLPLPGGALLCRVPRAEVVRWWGAAAAAGATAVGQEAFDTFRVESGLPWYGRDVTADTIALEAPYEGAISSAKGCYLGQEVVERVAARGHVNRKLVGLAIEGARAPSPDDAIRAGEREVGRVTSVAWSWRLACPIALGYVRREHWDPGVTLTVATRDGTLTATVRALPLV